MLLRGGADPNAPDENGKTILSHLSFGRLSGNPELVDALLDAGVDLAARLGDGSTMLQAAATLGTNPTAVRHALDAGADPNAALEGGMTLLHLAAKWNANPDIVETLVAAGASSNARGGNGLTPLHMAAQFNRTRMSWASCSLSAPSPTFAARTEPCRCTRPLRTTRVPPLSRRCWTAAPTARRWDGRGAQGVRHRQRQSRPQGKRRLLAP